MFVRGGAVGPGYLDYAGDTGFYWSSISVNSGLADYLYFDSGYVYPSSSLRFYGQSVRCVALGG